MLGVCRFVLLLLLLFAVVVAGFDVLFNVFLSSECYGFLWLMCIRCVVYSILLLRYRHNKHTIKFSILHRYFVWYVLEMGEIASFQLA